MNYIFVLICTALPFMWLVGFTMGYIICAKEWLNKFACHNHWYRKYIELLKTTQKEEWEENDGR